ncbi:hypothetical protein L798_08797, partial [Zootermopsis nevadensis]
FGECSRTCGGGVKKSVRHCNKPIPSNGGRYCTGRREKYRSCGARECPPGSKGFREEQCAVFNNNNYNIQGLPEDVKWVPKYGGISPDERCKLYCRVHGTSAYYPLKEKVVDGTPCGPDTYDICVNGICKPAGCNHMLGSSMQLDMCGKCGGDNSTCISIKGSYNNSTYGYTRVVRIPAGSSNLDIRQYGHKGITDDNYLALVDEDTGEYILNGGFMVSIFRKILLFGGATLEYTGSQTVVERVNSSSRPLKKDLILEVLSVGRLYPPNITFQYTVQRSTQYRWELRDKWTACDKVCNGERWPLPLCVKMDNSQHVPDEHCAGLRQLSRYIESCNTHCILKWRTWPITECSTHCGHGKQTLGLQCVQQFHDSNIGDNTVHNSSCAHLYKPTEVVDCEGPCNSTHWEFGMWSQCSKTCGGGTQTRSAHCVDERGWPKDESDCKQSDPPVVERPCGTQECPKWVLGESSPCSVTCGVGERKNSLWCQVGNRIVAPRYCDSQPVPPYKEVCTREPCASWHHGSWQQCSVTCGTGVSVRTVTCRSLDGKEVSESSCSTIENKPASSQKCTRQACQHEIPVRVITSVLNLNFLRGVWKASDWGSCSVTCGDGIRQRAVICIDSSLGTPIDKEHCTEALFVATEESCKQPTCASWRVGVWKPCSVSCGKGISTREVMCIDSASNTVLSNDQACSDHNLAQPDREKECYIRDCPDESSLEYPNHDGMNDMGKDLNNAGYMWRTGPWGECSKSCGTGYMRRMVACPSEDGNDGIECNKADRPVDRIACNTDPCPAWNTGGWSECNKSCGEGGYQHRQVRCQSHTGEILADTSCSALERPDEKHECDLPQCHINYSHTNLKPIAKEYQWRTGMWSQCSRTCGQGERNRRVVCVEVPANTYPYEQSVNHHWHGSTFFDSQYRKQYRDWRLVERQQRLKPKLLNETDIVVSSVKCDHRHMPKAVRGCIKQCPFSWFEGEWSECSQSCGHGIQQRTVQCHHLDLVVSEDECNPTERPSEQRNCFNSNCQDEFYWVPGEWQDCSHSCGRKGRQQRHLYCYHRDGKKVTRNNCVRAPRPLRKRKCNQHRCSFTSCLDVQQKLQAREDKEYTLQIMGINVSIYCHGMSTDGPQEYLSLPAGEDENFSEIYDRRLVSPDTCPYNGQRRDNCSCVVDSNGKAQLTMYSKVRLNITSLRVITQDGTFSRQVKGQHGRVPYGQAGDCYSKAECPQGRFSINLVGTNFIVSVFTRWEGKGSKPSKKIHWSEGNQKVSGKCGGYCGTC